MLVKELTLRRIIREEARRALRESDDIPTPTASVGNADADPATTTWKDGEYTYSYNLGTDQMFIVSGPKMTAPTQVTKTSNSTAYYTIRNQYEHLMGLPKTKPVLPLTDETEIFNMIKDVMSRYNLQIQSCYNNRTKQIPDLKGIWILSFTINKNGTVKNAKATPVQGTTPDVKLEADMAKTVGLWTFAALAQEQPVTKTVKLGSNGY